MYFTSVSETARLARPMRGDAEVAAAFRIAVVLHGRMGGLASLKPDAPKRPVRSLYLAEASVASAANCAASLERHLIGPLVRHGATADVIGHSWSPEIGFALDTLFGTARSLHEVGAPKDGFRCPVSGFSKNYCHRTVSHMRGIGRAMRLKRAEEQARGFEYDAVFLSRWDVLWARTMQLEALPGWAWPRDGRSHNARAVWLPRICAPLLGGAANEPLRTAVCGGPASPFSASQAVRECDPIENRACQSDLTAEARQTMVMDWWLIFGSSRAADAFARGVSEEFAEQGREILRRLCAPAEKREATAMGHFWFGAQLLWRMNATLRHYGNIGVDFQLGRAWDDFRCVAMRGDCTERACGASDVRRRPWQTAAARWPDGAAAAGGALPRPPSYPEPQSPMVRSCEERYAAIAVDL
jgi:hypothetical protein